LNKLFLQTGKGKLKNENGYKERPSLTLQTSHLTNQIYINKISSIYNPSIDESESEHCCLYTEIDFKKQEYCNMSVHR